MVLMMTLPAILIETNAAVTELPPTSPPKKMAPAQPQNILNKKTSGLDRNSSAQSPDLNIQASPAANRNAEISASDNVLIKKACRLKQYDGPAAYHECESQQRASLRNSTAPSFERVSSPDLVLIKKACQLKQYDGPAAYHECEREQAASLRNSSQPSFEGVSSRDGVLIKKACRLKQYDGPADYHACEHEQIRRIRK